MASAVLEAVWANALSASAGFSVLLPTVVFAGAVVGSMIGLAAAMRHVPTGTAYAVWTSVGTVLTVAYAAAMGNEELSWLKVLFLASIILFVISSWMCGLAPTLPFLLASRVLQGIGGAMLLPFYGGQGTDFVVNGSLLLAFFYLVVIGTSLTFSLYLNGAQKIGGAKAGILSCAEPLSSALLSLLLLGITFTLPDWLGTLLILASVVLIAIDSRRRVRAA